MAQDTLTAIKESQAKFRDSARFMCALGGVTPPETEREWLLFSLNQGLRNRGWGKPLDWNPDQEKLDALEAELAALQQ